MPQRQAQPKSRDEGESGPNLLDKLENAEAATVLKRLVTEHPELRAEAGAMARAVLGEASFLGVAGEVESAILLLDYDDLNSRVGSHSWGYVEPAEAAWELLEEAVEPLVADMKRRVEMGLEEEGREICEGILLGLYRVREGGGSDILGWAEDFPAETAAGVLEAWTGGADTETGPPSQARRRAVMPREFVDQHVPDWEWIAGPSQPRGKQS